MGSRRYIIFLLVVHRPPVQDGGRRGGRLLEKDLHQPGFGGQWRRIRATAVLAPLSIENSRASLECPTPQVVEGAYGRPFAGVRVENVRMSHGCLSAW